jgi:hypothetical protein
MHLRHGTAVEYGVQMSTEGGDPSQSCHELDSIKCIEVTTSWLVFGNGGVLAGQSDAKTGLSTSRQVDIN